MKKLLFSSMIVLAIAPSTFADFSLSSTDNGDGTQTVTVNSDYAKLNGAAMHLGYDSSSLEVTNVNSTLFDKIDQATADESGINFSSTNDIEKEGVGTALTFNVAKKDGATGSNFTIELTEGSATTESGTENATPSSIDLSFPETLSTDVIPTVDEVNVNGGQDETKTVSAKGETSVKTGNEGYLTIAFLLLAMLSFLVYSKSGNKKEA